MNEEPIYQLPDDDLLPEEVEEDIVDEEEDSQEEPVKKKRPNPFWALLKVMLGPKDGWRQLKRAKMSPDKFASGCFYPLLVVASLTEFADMFFEANRTVPEILVQCVQTFMTYFMGYFIALLCSINIVPKDCKEMMHTNFSKVFIMAASSTLLLFHALLNLLPMFEPVLVFLPIWTIFMIVRGVRLLRIPSSRETSMSGLISLFVIASPLFCWWLLSEIIPK